MKKLLTALALGSTITATAYAQRPQTDRERDGLKGPVKSVTVEAATLERQGERYVEGPRVLAERVTYNAEGNRAEDEWYADDDGTLVKKTVYRYVGGERLADAQVIIPVVIAPTITARAGCASPPARPPVPRPRAMRPVSEKYKYRYDDQGRVREMTIEEDGRVRTRVTYAYQSGQMEMRSYLDGGSAVTYRRVDRFDARGNLVESTDFYPDVGGADKYSYTGYEFDAGGNWVKRMKLWSGPGQPEERKVEYRTITYF